MMWLQMLFEWSQVCGDQVDRFTYRLDICVPKGIQDDFKKGGNGKSQTSDSTIDRIH
jgi:hypothetical protein